MIYDDRRGRGVNRWVWSISPENWDVVKDRSIWAVDEERKTRRVQDSDFIVFYVKGTGLFRGIFQVAGEWRRSAELVWGDEKESGEKIYPYEWGLKPFLIKDVIFNSVCREMGFTKQYPVNPSIVLRGSSGPANFGRPISEDDMKLLASRMTSVIKPENKEAGPGHEEVIERLRVIGDALGFEAHTGQDHTLVAPGCVVDMMWETRVGSIGAIKYAFEVQSKGSIKSLITNLIQSMNDPAVTKVVAVSDARQLDQIRDIVNNTSTHSDATKSKFVFLDVDAVGEFSDLVPKLNEFKSMLAV